MIPLFNPAYEFEVCREDIVLAFQRVAASGMYISAGEVARFEAAFAGFHALPHAVGVASGTSALELMLRADGVGRGTQVVLTAHTFVADVEAILATGAEPRFVDIDPVTWQMPAGDWPDCVVLVCHLYGGVSPAIRSTGRTVYEDASQSLGATLDGLPVGTLSRAAAFSLYPTKNLGALGDAGVVLTRDEALAVRLRAIRNHGQTAPQFHAFVGTTGRLDEIQAAILAAKLLRMKEFLKARREQAAFYLDHLRDLPLTLPEQIPGSESAPHLFVVRTAARSELRRALQEQGIATGIHYPTPIHRMPAYEGQSWTQVDLPQTDALCATILSLPLWVGLSADDQARLVNAVRAFFSADGRA